MIPLRPGGRVFCALSGGAEDAYRLPRPLPRPFPPALLPPFPPPFPAALLPPPLPPPFPPPFPGFTTTTPKVVSLVFPLSSVAVTVQSM